MDPLLRTLRAELRSAGDPARALGAQRYMKSEMPFHGVAAPVFRAACKRVFAGLSFGNAAAWRGAVLALWRGARFREERYGAIELTGLRAAVPFQDMDTLPMYEEMVVTGAWWDLVDSVAKLRLGLLLRRHPGPMKREMLAWSRDVSLWKRRSAILCQLAFKAETDIPFLYACIEPSLGSQEFFLRKAIGWALRQLAWTDPDEVVRYVRANAARLSGLTKREALKNVLRGCRIDAIP